MMAAKFLKKHKDKILFRQAGIRRLYSFIGTSDEPMPHSVFLFGHVATGKSMIVETLLKYLKYNYSIINCIEHSNPKHMFDYILSDLSDDGLNQKCDNFADFTIRLKKIAESDDRPIVIVFDKCERLRDVEFTFLPALLRLKELSGVNVCTIFISNIVWEKFRVKIGMLEPLKIHFKQYTREEMMEILLLHKPGDYSEAFYRNYLNLFLSVFFRFCRDLNELSHMAKVNFIKYVEPIENGRCSQSDASALWRNISTIMKSNLEVIYLRVSTEDFIQGDKVSKEIESTTKLALSFELPFYAKYMLIAAYLASYNPAKEDKHIFMKRGGKRKKKAQPSKKTIVSASQSGPRSFSISRMLAIFCCILDEKVDVNASLLAQIPTMCQLGLLTPVADNNLDEPKVKCCVSYDFVTVISKTVGFNVKSYLYDSAN